MNILAHASRIFSRAKYHVAVIKNTLAPKHRWVYTRDEAERTCTVCGRKEFEDDDAIAGYRWGELQPGRADAHKPKRPSALAGRF